MIHAFAEAVALLLPADAGGRCGVIAPRDGTYRTFARTPDGELLSVRFIEGPPGIGPGDHASVVLEVDGPQGVKGLEGMELAILEHDAPVGYLSVRRVWNAVAPS